MMTKRSSHATIESSGNKKRTQSSNLYSNQAICAQRTPKAQLMKPVRQQNQTVNEGLTG